MKNGGRAAEWLGLLLVSAILVSFVRILYPIAAPNNDTAATDGSDGAPPIVVIIDAGHGGEDGGAVGVTGALEKDINLEVSLVLRDMLTLAGVEAVMTRTEDRLLYTEEQNIKGHRKENDLRNRLVMSEGYENGMLVSVHMNTFPEESCRGLQVYYSPNDPDSRIVADNIQSSARALLQPYNNRHTKEAGSSIYLLHRSNNPAVLVECGFLSNWEECAKLSTKDYQRRLSFSIFCGIMEYINSR